MNWPIYTLWAADKSQPEAPWMIAAEDEASWEGNPDRCDEVFARARLVAEVNGWEVREVTITVDFDEVTAAFASVSVRGVAAVPAPGSAGSAES